MTSNNPKNSLKTQNQPKLENLLMVKTVFSGKEKGNTTHR
jgi:hypothetical protein